MPQANLRIHDAVLTHPGKVRRQNEDHVLAKPEQGIWVVADGMGGHSNGQWASETITKTLAEAQLSDDFDTAVAAAAAAIHKANREIWVAAVDQGLQMGSTVVALIVRDARFAVLWAGDSRCYLLRMGQLYQLSVDHSIVQEMVASGLLSPEEAAVHPMGNVLSRAVGVGEALELDAVSDQVQPGDIFLVCSDGLTRTISDEELPALLTSGQPEPTAEQLVSLCLARGAPDNVSVAVISCDETTVLALADA